VNYSSCPVMKHITPKPKLLSFTCPHCQVLAYQEWSECALDLRTYQPQIVPAGVLGKAFQQDPNPLKVGKCAHCSKRTIWLDGALLYPNTGHAPAANEDLSPQVKKIYNEAASIVRLSPRAAAALLRLAVERICKELGQKGDLSSMIQSLLDEQKITAKIQAALDVVRVTGNEAVHPGEIDEVDDLESADILFELVNAIANHAITQPRMIDETYAKLPLEKRKSIEQRGKKNSKE